VRRTNSNVAAGLVAFGALALAVGISMVFGGADDDTPTADAQPVAADIDTTPVAATDAPAETTSPTTVMDHDMAGTEHDAAHGADPGDDLAHAHVDGPAMQYDEFPAETRAQLDVVSAIIAKYPTAGDAMADGWTPATINLRGIAAHFLKGGPGGFLNMDGTFDVAQPEILLFDGIEADAPIVGVSYLVSGETPEGFAGDFDVWHRHDAVCFANGLVIGEIGGHEGSKIDVGEQACKDAGGLTFPLSNLSMIHVWMVPDFPSPNGVFSHDHAGLDNPES
jgi:hypothetical protein